MVGMAMGHDKGLQIAAVESGLFDIGYRAVKTVSGAAVDEHGRAEVNKVNGAITPACHIRPADTPQDVSYLLWSHINEFQSFSRLSSFIVQEEKKETVETLERLKLFFKSIPSLSTLHRHGAGRRRIR